MVNLLFFQAQLITHICITCRWLQAGSQNTRQLVCGSIFDLCANKFQNVNLPYRPQILVSIIFCSDFRTKPKFKIYDLENGGRPTYGSYLNSKSHLKTRWIPVLGIYIPRHLEGRSLVIILWKKCRPRGCRQRLRGPHNTCKLQHTYTRAFFVFRGQARNDVINIM